MRLRSFQKLTILVFALFLFQANTITAQMDSVVILKSKIKELRLSRDFTETNTNYIDLLNRVML